MTILFHGYAGAVSVTLLERVLGVDGGLVAPAVGFVLGVIPDGLDWVLARAGRIPRWSLYQWFHDPGRLSLVVQWILFPMALHTQVFDPWVHSPVLPTRGPDSPVPVIDDRVKVVGVWVARRTLFWIYAEVAAWAVVTLALVLAR